MRIFFAPRFKLAATAVIVLTVACVLSTVMINLLICRPITLNWQAPLKGNGACENEEAALMAIGILDLANQLAIIMLPLPRVFKSGMETRCKIITTILFSTGIL